MKTPNKMCLSKQMYGNKKEALKALRWARKEGEETWFPLDTLRVYKCPLCLKFHLGNSLRRS